jgi:hypothetical protein
MILLRKTKTYATKLLGSVPPPWQVRPSNLQPPPPSTEKGGAFPVTGFLNYHHKLSMGSISPTMLRMGCILVTGLVNYHYKWTTIKKQRNCSPLVEQNPLMISLISYTFCKDHFLTSHSSSSSQNCAQVARIPNTVTNNCQGQGIFCRLLMINRRGS